jgi:energy-coupling factor transporter ATP-binding protein EcfA2
MTAAIEFHGVSRVFGDVRAVDDVSFSIEPGEFFAMLGPSGSGKTSCLRLVAGFDSPDRGQVLLDGQDVSAVPPYDRCSARAPSFRHSPHLFAFTKTPLDFIVKTFLVVIPQAVSRATSGKHSVDLLRRVLRGGRDPNGRPHQHRFCRLVFAMFCRQQTCLEGTRIHRQASRAELADARGRLRNAWQRAFKRQVVLKVGRRRRRGSRHVFNSLWTAIAGPQAGESTDDHEQVRKFRLHG